MPQPGSEQRDPAPGLIAWERGTAHALGSSIALWGRRVMSGTINKGLVQHNLILGGHLGSGPSGPGFQPSPLGRPKHDRRLLGGCGEQQGPFSPCPLGACTAQPRRALALWKQVGLLQACRRAAGTADLAACQAWAVRPWAGTCLLNALAQRAASQNPGRPLADDLFCNFRGRRGRRGWRRSVNRGGRVRSLTSVCYVKQRRGTSSGDPQSTIRNSA